MVHCSFIYVIKYDLPYFGLGNKIHIIIDATAITDPEIVMLIQSSGLTMLIKQRLPLNKSSLVMRRGTQ